MKFFVSIFFCFILLQAKAQLGLIHNDSLLLQARTSFTGPPNGPGTGPQTTYTYFNYLLLGDTTINNQFYHKLYKSSASNSAYFNPSILQFFKYVSEDSGRVFLDTGINKRLILDYNLLLGDSFKFSSYNPKLVLLSKDSVLIQGNYYPRFNFQKNIRWVKGIGDVRFGMHYENYAFFNTFSNPYYSAGASFDCYFENFNQITGTYCHYIGLDEYKEGDKLILFPNPAINEIDIVLPGLTENLSLSILDLNGKQVLEKTFKGNTQIDVSTFPKGVYFVRITGTTINLSKRIVVVN
jgi:hypothetical protein